MRVRERSLQPTTILVSEWCVCVCVVYYIYYKYKRKKKESDTQREWERERERECIYVLYTSRDDTDDGGMGMEKSNMLPERL